MDLIETNLTESRLITPRNKINLLLLTTIVNIIGRQGAFEKKNVHQDVYDGVRHHYPSSDKNLTLSQTIVIKVNH